MKTIAVMNYKGGVGKTVTAINLAAELAAKGKTVALIDGDAQCNTTRFFVPEGTEDRTLYDLLTYRLDPHVLNMLRETVVPGLRLLPASMELMRADISALQSGAVDLDAIRRLCDALAAEESADYVVIDCPPSFSAATTAALAAADEVIIPSKLDAFSLDGMTELLIQIDSMRRINAALRIAGVLITMWTRSIAVRNAEDVLRRSAVPVFQQTIRRSTVVDESTYERRPLRLYKPCSGVAADYAAFAAEYLEGGVSRG